MWVLEMVFTCEDWVLLQIYAGGGTLKGKTRIHKGIFLVHEEITSITTPEFKPGSYGPWSIEIEKAIEKLEKEGFIEIRKVPGGDESEAFLYILTDKGFNRAKQLWEELKKHPEFKRIELRLKFAAKAPLTSLLAYVYGAYPLYAEKSKIAEKVSKWSF